MLGLRRSLKLLYNYVKGIFYRIKLLRKLLSFNGEKNHELAVCFAHIFNSCSSYSMFNISTAVPTKSMLVHICSLHHDVSISPISL